MRLLIVEDQQNISEFLKSALQAECFAVDTCADGAKGLYLAKTNDYDLILLDNILPNKSGAQICRELRESGRNVPIIMVSVMDEVSRKVNVLQDGADDYITKPFKFEELLARIKAVLRRPKIIENEIFTADDLILDYNRHFCSRSGNEIKLTRKELSLLQYFMKNQGQVLSRGMIMEHVWDINGDLFSNTIETHILNLRKKINLSNKPNLINTISGRGYRFESPAHL